MKHFSDEQLEKSADQARVRERIALNDMLLHLKEIDRRRLYSKRKFPSLYEYAMERFKYSYDEVHRRVCAMKVLKEMPEIESKIIDGSLHLTHLTQAQSFFKKVEHTKEEKLEILAKLENTSKAETKKILYNEDIKARYSFEADKSFEEIVERLKGLHPHLCFDDLMRKVCTIALEQLDPMVKAQRINAKQEAIKGKQEAIKLKQEAKDASESRKSRAGAKRDQGQSASVSTLPRASDESRAGAKVPSRYIAAEVKREVWLKAQGKCENCSSTFALEYDHIVPFAMGGESRIENLRLLCRSCNQRRGIEVYGSTQMNRFRDGQFSH